MRIRSPKTEHHEGKDSRLVPIFPELRPHLEEVFDAAAPGTEYVITRYRDRNSNLRTQLERIIAKAGLKTWPKIFQNLRSTRETELTETFPIHVVCAWLGNSEAVAAKHYLQVTDEHFEEAARKAAQSEAVTPSTVRESKSKRLTIAEANGALPHCTTILAPPEGLEPSTSGLTVRCSTN